MVKSPPNNRIMLACLLFLVFMMVHHEVRSQKGTSIDFKKIPEDYMIIEGYVDSKRIGSILINDKPISRGDRLIGYFTSNYRTSSTIIVSRHKNAENQNIFKGLKSNQKVRVYGDNLRESNPGKIKAYYIEIIENEH
ncbi:DUF3221 domain-containing protein [Bacillus sp. JJ1562]|uniref:DUF3221 domain-containing protein n=1 Tax=Bacillus sp. JJ1562 TaxID=3122960 RepID=UPI003002EBD2